MAAHLSASLALGYSEEFVTVVTLGQFRARRLASNSTGRVIRVKSTVMLINIIPISSTTGLPRKAIITPIKSIQFTMDELNCTVGTILLRILSHLYAAACCKA